MIPQKSTIKRTDTTVGREILMQIAPEATEQIMEYLIKLYHDPEMACVREAATNAFDSHIAAGQTKPIEIATPSRLLPLLIIKDWGVGLNAEDFDQIYSRYGISTKRESNEFNGTLGLGCKSPLAYVDQFTVIGIKDGVCTTVSVARHENRGATMKIIDESPTEDPNGVEIQIPAKPDNQFKRNAEKLFQFWQEGTVLLDGKVPPRFQGTEVNKKLFLTQDLDNHYVVMGNVPYPVSSHFEGLTGGFKLVAYVEMGEVSFTPSRESLEMNDVTKATIEQIKNEFSGALTATVQREIDALSTAKEALEGIDLWRGKVSSTFLGDITYRGKTIPSDFRRMETDPAGDVAGDIVVTARVHAEEGAHSISGSIGAARIPTGYFVENWTGVKFNINHKRKLQKYLTAQNILASNQDKFILTRKRFVEVESWVDPVRFLDWNEVKKVRVKTYRERGVRDPNITYDGYKPNANYRSAAIPLSDIFAAKYVFYYERPKEYYRGSASPLRKRYAEVLTDHYPEAYLIEFPATRTERFKREVPHAIPVKKAFEKFSKEAKKVKVDDLRALRFRSEFPGIERLDPARVKDPQVRKAIRLAKRETSKLITSLYAADDALTFFGYSVRLSADISNPFEPYTLLLMRNHWGELGKTADVAHEHFYIYVNAVYQQRKKEAKVNVPV